jgi:hypothetical protein
MARKDMQNQAIIAGVKAASFGIGGGISEMSNPTTSGKGSFGTGFKQSMGRYFRGDY